jgi:hypothetical protein
LNKTSLDDPLGATPLPSSFGSTIELCLSRSTDAR